MRTIIKKCVFIIVVLGIISIGPFADSFEFEPSSISFKVSALAETGKCGDNVTWQFNKTTGELVIRGTGEMYCEDTWWGIIFISDSPFENASEIKKITIEEGITLIDAYAFENCDGLISVVLPSSLNKVGYGAFRDCDAITSITLPNSLTEIASYAFIDCDKLSSIVIGNNVSSIGGNAFSSCDSLESITVVPDNLSFFSDEHGVLCDKKNMEIIQYPIGNKRSDYIIPEGIITIGSESFRSCKNLERITFRDSIEKIETDAFNSCENLKEVTIPDSVTSIGAEAFAYCEGLEKIVIGDGVKSLYDVFDDCKNVKSIYIGDSVTSSLDDLLEYRGKLENYFVSEGNTKYSSIDGVLLTKDKKTLRRYPQGKLVSTYTVPSTVEIIEEDAFYNTKIKKIIAPSNVKKLEMQAFYEAENLTDIFLYNDKCEIYSGSESEAHSWDAIPETVTIHGYPISTAQTYAEKKKMTFVPIEDHTHSFGPWRTTTAATCIQKGVTIRICSSCEYAETKTIDFTDHDYSSWKTVVEAACETEGLKKRTCPACGESETKNISATGHNYNSSWTVDKKATCTESGSKSHHCINCDAQKDVTVIKATGHSYGEWQTVSGAVCTNGGTRKKVCENCGDSVVEDVVALGHNYSTEWTVDKKATCVSKGSKSHHCINCGDKKDVTSIEKTEHKYKTKTTKATTKTNGKKVYTCSVCNDVVTKEIAKIKTIKLSKTNYTYNKKVKTPSVIVKDSKGNSLKKGTHYTVTYSKGRKAVGTYSVKIVFKGNYSGSKTLKFTVTLGKVTNLEQIKSEKGIAFSWNSVVGATGYQIYTYDAKTKKYFLLIDATKTRLKNANAKGIMSFKVRAYYKAKDGTMHYGEFSDVKTFKSI